VPALSSTKKKAQHSEFNAALSGALGHSPGW
jgi:hypothetical protein